MRNCEITYVLGGVVQLIYRNLRVHFQFDSPKKYVHAFGLVLQKASRKFIVSRIPICKLESSSVLIMRLM